MVQEVCPDMDSFNEKAMPMLQARADQIQVTNMRREHLLNQFLSVSLSIRRTATVEQVIWAGMASQMMRRHVAAGGQDCQAETRAKRRADRSHPQKQSQAEKMEGSQTRLGLLQHEDLRVVARKSRFD